MRLLFDALSARDGGAVTFVQSVLPAMRAVEPKLEIVLLWSSRYQADVMRQVRDVAELHDTRLPAENQFGRWMFQQWNMRSLARRYGSEFLFTSSEIGCRNPGVPHVVLAHNFMVIAPWHVLLRNMSPGFAVAYRFTRQPFAWATLRSADRVICPTDAFRRQLVDAFGLHPAATSVVPHGVDPVFFEAEQTLPKSRKRARRAERRILTVANFGPHKNFETLLAAVAALRRSERCADVKLRVVGSGTAAAERAVREQASRLAVGDAVDFVGHLPVSALPAEYAAADVFVLASRIESFGLPLLEAMAAGVPVVASDIAACREVCAEAASFFDPADAEQLATHVAVVLEDNQTAGLMAARGLQRAATFSWQETARRTLEVVRSAGAEACAA